MRLHIGDDRGNILSFQEHQHHSGNNDIVIILQRMLVDVIHLRADIADPRSGFHILNRLNVLRIDIHGRHVITELRQEKAVAPASGA